MDKNNFSSQNTLAQASRPTAEAAWSGLLTLSFALGISIENSTTQMYAFRALHYNASATLSAWPPAEWRGV